MAETFLQGPRLTLTSCGSKSQRAAHLPLKLLWFSLLDELEDGETVANFFYSVGYGLEKVHSGMIAYLCDLWNEGEQEPLRSFLDYLQISIKDDSILRAAREWQSIDLLIFNAKDDSAIVAIEMKVDSSEGSVKGEPQTVVYPRRLPDDTPFLYVTLGVGEFHRSPRGERDGGVRWVRLRNFHGALDAISTDDCFIRGWKEAIANEVDLQDRSFSGCTSRLKEYRGRTWNLYLLGHLKETLVSSLSGRDIGIDPFVHAIGPAPDTILHFGKGKLPAYLEINDNGLLNMKVSFEGLATEAENKERLEKVRAYYLDLLSKFKPTSKSRKPNFRKKGATAISFDVGLTVQDRTFRYASSEADTTARLAEILEVFYENPPFDVKSSSSSPLTQSSS